MYAETQIPRDFTLRLYIPKLTTTLTATKHAFSYLRQPKAVFVLLHDWITAGCIIDEQLFTPRLVNDGLLGATSTASRCEAIFPRQPFHKFRFSSTHIADQNHIRQLLHPVVAI